MNAVAQSPIFGTTMVFYLAAMFVVGLLAMRVSRTADDFWVAGRRLGVGTLTGTWGATFISSITMLGMAGQAYANGWSTWMVANGTWVGPLIMILTVQYFVRFMGFTIPDMFEARFGTSARIVSALITCLGAFGVMGVQMYAAGMVLSTIFGWSLPMAIILSSVVFIAYAVAGGFFAVVWTDCVQAVMLMVGIIATAIFAVSSVGGLTALNTQLVAVNPGYVDPWGVFKSPMIIMGLALAFGLGNPSQPWFLARAFAARNTQSIRIALANGALMNVWAVFCGVLIGMAARVILGPGIKPVDAVFPLVAIKLMPPIFAALVLAAIVAAIMSTADSLLMQIGTTVAHDFFHRFIRPDASHSHLLSITRWTIIIAGLLAIIIAIWQPGSILTVGAYVIGAVGAAFFVPLYGSFFWRRATTAGAIGGMLSGVVGVVFFTRVPVGIHPIIMGVLCALIAYVVLSLTTPPQYAAADDYFRRIGRQSAVPAPTTKTATAR